MGEHRFQRLRRTIAELLVDDEAHRGGEFSIPSQLVEHEAVQTRPVAGEGPHFLAVGEQLLDLVHPLRVSHVDETQVETELEMPDPAHVGEHARIASLLLTEKAMLFDE